MPKTADAGSTVDFDDLTFVQTTYRPIKAIIAAQSGCDGGVLIAGGGKLFLVISGVSDIIKKRVR